VTPPPPPPHGDAGTSTGEQGKTDNMAARTQEYLRKAKEKAVADIREQLGKDTITYDAIRSFNTRDTRAHNIIGENVYTFSYAEGMVASGDGRMLSGGLKLAMRPKRIVTSSWNADWTCLGCGTHGKRQAFKTRGEAGPCGQNQAVILADQSVPAIWPAAGSEQCIKILRVENGALLDIADEFLVQLGNRRFPPGGIIMLFSYSHMSNVGLTAYIEDFFAAEKMIKDKLGRDTKVKPLPPMLMSGSCCVPSIRTLWELMGWTSSYFAGDEAYLEDSHNVARKILEETGSDAQTNIEVRRYRLPGKNGPQLWHSTIEEGKSIPSKIRRLTSGDEMKIATTIITELREKLALDLDPSPTFERGRGLQARPKRKVEYLVVGMSNASRLSNALAERGCDSALVHLKTWRIFDGTSEAMAKWIRDTIEETDPDTVVFQMWDASTFFAKAGDGSLNAPRRLQDGKLHMLGTVTVCSTDNQREQLSIIKPLLDAVGRRQAVFITPMPRFITAGCCSDKTHACQRDDPNYKSGIVHALEMQKRTAKDFLYSQGKRNFTILDPNMDMRGLRDNEIWGDDPIHPLPGVYGRIADGVIKLTGILAAKLAARKEEPKRRRTDSTDEVEQEHRRSRQDHAAPPAGRGGHRGRGWYDNRPARGQHANGGRITRGYGGPPYQRKY
jgi:hypothetical protein